MHNFSLRERMFLIRVSGGKRRKHRVTKPGQRPDFTTRARQIHEQRAQWQAALKDDPEKYETVDIIYEIIENKLTDLAEVNRPPEYAYVEALGAKSLLQELKEAARDLNRADVGGTGLIVEIKNEVDAWIKAVMKGHAAPRQR